MRRKEGGSEGGEHDDRGVQSVRGFGRRLME